MKSAAVVADDVGGELDQDAAVAASVAELGPAGGAEVVGVHAEEAECLDGGGPQVEDVAGRSGLGVALEEDDVVTGLVYGQGGGHAARAGADDGHAASAGGGCAHGGCP